MDIAVRPTASREDEERSLAIYNAVWPRAAVTMDEVDSYKRSTRAYGDHLALIDGAAVGSAAVAVQPSRQDVGSASVTVLADHRGRGVGTALYREISRWCAAHGVDTIETPIEEEDAASMAFAQHRAFTVIERYGRMVLDLAGLDASTVGAPDGVKIVTWAERPDLAQGIYDVAVEAYRDMPGNEEDEMESFGDWLAHDMQGSADRPEATFVALAAGEVVGYAKFFLTAAQPSLAYHDTTGVKRAWRGRGVAGALKRAQIAWAKGQGYEQLVTGNELRNEPIRRLNAKLGYREEPGRVLMRGPLSGG